MEMIEKAQGRAKSGIEDERDPGEERNGYFIFLPYFSARGLIILTTGLHHVPPSQITGLFESLSTLTQG